MTRSVDIIKTSPEMWGRFTLGHEHAPDAPRDAHDRYAGAVPGNDDDHRAPVSRYLLEKGYEPRYPEGRRFSVVLTHDVDAIRPSRKRAAISAIRCAAQGSIGEMWAQLAHRSGSMDLAPYRRFTSIMDLEQRFGGRSTFFFMTSGPDRTGAGYPPREVTQDIVSIKGRGWEIGLHGGYEGYIDPEVMAREKAALEAMTGERVDGFRNHYLRFKAPHTWLALEKAGFRYDSTVGYAHRWGFRNGLAMPYRPVDPASGREIRLTEVPLALMDTTLYGYARLDPKRSWEVARGLLKEVMEVRGTMVVLWHNDTFANPKLRGYAEIYERILRFASENNGWLCSAGDAAKWWETHDE
jgi:hypothetical protein